MTTIDILRAARERIADPARWCQNVLAMCAGVPASPSSSIADHWCGVGALYAVCDMNDMTRARHLLECSSLDLYGKQLDGVNDRLGHAAVMAVYDEAIRRAEAEEKSCP